jgi:hypothetical protein
MQTLTASQIALPRGDAPKSIQVLEAASAYELGRPWSRGLRTPFPLYPCLRPGNAFLVAHRASEAEAEFQKTLQWHGLVLNAPIGALAISDLGARMFSREPLRKTARRIRIFFALGKDADPEIPILKQRLSLFGLSLK